MDWVDKVEVEVLSKGQPHMTRLRITIGDGDAFETTLSAIASLYQKAVRRGDAFLTVICVIVYYRAGNSFAVFDKLRVFALEDKAGSCTELLEAIDQEATRFKEAYSKKSGISKSNLRAGVANEIFPEGLEYAIDSALKVCWCKSSRIGATLAFTALSEAVSKDMPFDTKPDVLSNYEEELNNARKLAIKEVARAWSGYGLGEDGEKPPKRTPSQQEKLMLQLLRNMYNRLSGGKSMPAAYERYAVHRLGFSTMAAEVCLGLESGVNRDKKNYPRFRDMDGLPGWALDKHTSEGRQKLASSTRDTGEDKHTLGLKQMFDDSFELNGHEVNREENAFWNRVGRATYMWWDSYHLTMTEGKKRSYSLGKTNHLLDFWTKLAGGKATRPLVREHSTQEKKGTKRAVERVFSPAASSSATSSSSSESKKQKKTPAARHEQQTEFFPLDPSKKIGFPLSILRTMYCAAQLPTRTGKQMLTYYALNEKGQRVWRKGPFEKKMWPEAWAEIDADGIFDVLPGVEARGLKQINIEGEIFIESPALFWPPSFVEKESTVLNIKSIRVGVMPEDARVRSLNRADIERLAEKKDFELLAKILNASILKRELGCNDLVLRNLIVDFDNDLVYPIDCTVLQGERKPSVFHGAAKNVRDILTDTRVRLRPDLYRSWARQLELAYPVASANLLRFSDLGTEMSADLFPSN